MVLLQDQSMATHIKCIDDQSSGIKAKLEWKCDSIVALLIHIRYGNCICIAINVLVKVYNGQIHFLSPIAVWKSNLHSCTHPLL